MSIRVRTAILTSTLAAASLTAATPAYAQKTTGEFREVRVGRSETLAALSFRVYGTHRLWWRIYQWNRETISDPNRLKRGQKIRVSTDSQIMRLAQAWRKANGITTALVDQWLGTSEVHSSAAAPVKPIALLANAALAPQGVNELTGAPFTATITPEPAQTVAALPAAKRAARRPPPPITEITQLPPDAEVISNVPTPAKTPAPSETIDLVQERPRPTRRNPASTTAGPAPALTKPLVVDLFSEPVPTRGKTPTPPPSPHLELKPFWGLEMP